MCAVLEGQIKFFFPASYFPQLNADEQAWQSSEDARIGKVGITSLEDLRAEVIAVLAVAKNPTRAFPVLHHLQALRDLASESELWNCGTTRQCSVSV